MSFILNEDTENAPTFTTLPTGTEAELRICSAELKNSKKGDPMMALRFDIPDEPFAKDIFHYIMLPAPADDDKKRAQKLNRLKDFKACFGLPASGPIASEDMEGCRGWAILREEDGLNGELQNSIQKFVIGG